MLFVPATSEEKLAKIAGFGALPCIIDLEDSVAIGLKESARAIAAEHITIAGGTERLWVRINALPSAWGRADIAAVALPGLRGIVVPKVEEAGQLIEIDELLRSAEHEQGLHPGTVKVMASIETVRGLANARAIAAVGGRLERLGFGAGDFSRDIGLEWPDPDGLSPTLEAAKIELVLASRLAGLLPPDDGSYPRYRDPDGLRTEAHHAKRLGFGGKHAIHPDQVPVIEEVFQPSAEALERARRIVAAFEEAESAGRAAVGLDGVLIDYPVVYRAMELLGIRQRPGTGGEGE
jgi:citrate lyase beta subunit